MSALGPCSDSHTLPPFCRPCTTPHLRPEFMDGSQPRPAPWDPHFLCLSWTGIDSCLLPTRAADRTAPRMQLPVRANVCLCMCVCVCGYMCVCAHTHMGLGNRAGLPVPVGFALLGVPEHVKSNYPEAGPADVHSQNFIWSQCTSWREMRFNGMSPQLRGCMGIWSLRCFFCFFLVPGFPQLQKKEYMKKTKISLNQGCGTRLSAQHSPGILSSRSSLATRGVEASLGYRRP